MTVANFAVQVQTPDGQVQVPRSGLTVTVDQTSGETAVSRANNGVSTNANAAEDGAGRPLARLN